MKDSRPPIPIDPQGLVALISLFGVGGIVGTAEAQNIQIPKFLVSYYASYFSIATENPGTSEAAVTVASVTSISQALCTVAVVWRNEIGGEICRTNSTRLLPGGTENHCSRPIVPVSGQPTCNAEMTCPMPLDNQEGSIVVLVEQQCENQIDVDARIHYTVITEAGPPPSEVILGTHSPRITRIGNASLE